MTQLPDAMKFVTLDEMAECYPVSRELCAKLWSLVPATKPNADGLIDGEVPEPDSANRVARSLKKHWANFNDEEQLALIEAYKKG